MLEPILCGLLAQAPFIPKLQGHFAEFLNNASPAGLRILSSSTCVGLRYGHVSHNSGFSRQPESPTSLLLFAPRHTFGLLSRFTSLTPPVLAPVFSFPGLAVLLCPHSSDDTWCRNFHLLSIGYVFRPDLRPRLTQSDQLYSGNLRYSAWRIPTSISLLIPAFSLLNTPRLLTVPLRRPKNAPLPMYNYIPKLRCCVLAPDIFGAGPLD